MVHIKSRYKGRFKIVLQKAEKGSYYNIALKEKINNTYWKTKQYYKIYSLPRARRIMNQMYAKIK